MTSARVVASSLGLLVGLAAGRASAEDLHCRHVQQPAAGGTNVSVLRCDEPRNDSGHIMVAWTAGATGVLLLGVGAVFQGIAIHQQDRINDFANMRDPATGLPTVSWSELGSLEDSRNLNQGVAIGCFVAGGIGLAIATTLFLWPRRSAPRAAASAGGLGTLAVRPGGAGLTLSF